VTEDLGQALQNLALPLADLDGVDLKLAGELGGGLQAADRLQGDLGLEVGGVAIAGFGHDRRLLSADIVPPIPNLPTCPESGVHFSFAK